MEPIQLDDNYIIMAEQAIADNKLGNISNLCISYQYYKTANMAYSAIKDAQVTSYIRFSENAMGMQVCGFYKARNGGIYIINSFMNEIQTVYDANANGDFIIK